MKLALRQSLKYKPHGVALGGMMMREAYMWGKLQDLNASTREGVAAAASCDRAMYTDALRRMRLAPPGRLGEALNRSHCSAAVYVGRQRSASM